MEYGDLVELGFEGVDRFADKYHDRIYGHLPAWKKQQQQQQQHIKAQHEQSQQQHQHQQREFGPAKEQQRERHDSATRNPVGERDMSSYANSYAPNGRHEYRDERDARVDRYYQPLPQAPQQPHQAAAYGYEYDDRIRPGIDRQRSYSWSPPRNERREDSRRRRRSRERYIESELRDQDSKRRFAATVVGGLVGGVAGNQLQKGKKYDTVATIGGAILGGIASREIADRVGNKREDRREKRDDEQEKWEQKFGEDDREWESERDRRRSSRDARGWCDRCRCERSRCWCR